MRYMVVVEEGPASFGAYVPDLPGCVAAAASRDDVLRLIREAIEFHLEGMKQDGVAIPEPHSTSELVDVRAAYCLFVVVSCGGNRIFRPARIRTPFVPLALTRSP